MNRLFIDQIVLYYNVICKITTYALCFKRFSFTMINFKKSVKNDFKKKRNIYLKHVSNTLDNSRNTVHDV